MTSKVKLTIAAANLLLRAIKWRAYSTEYQVMVRKDFVDSNGDSATTWQPGRPATRWQPSDHLWPQDTYRDALDQLDRLSEADRANAAIFRIKTERPA